MKRTIAMCLVITLTVVASTLGEQRSRRAELEFIAPRNNQVIAGDNVLLWVAESPQSIENSRTGRQLLFELSLDGESFQPLPQQSAPDLGPGSHTTTIDTRTLPVGMVFLRARLPDANVTRTIQVRVNRLPEPSCRVVPNKDQKGEVLFDCSRSQDVDGRIVSYHWKFGDGTNSATPTPLIRHRYRKEGRFPFELTVTDDDSFTSTLLRDVVYLSGFFMMDDRKDCGCEQMTIAATGKSILGDYRRKKDDAFEPVPLGLDPDYVSLNFEVSAALKDDSDPDLCSEGQDAKATFKWGTVLRHKKACTAGRDLDHCGQNSDCDTGTCQGGFKNGQSCDDRVSLFACKLGGGVCRANGDGVCTEYPFAGLKRGNDDYRRDYPKGEGLKIHCPSCGAPTWVDAPGFPDFDRVYADKDIRVDLDFLAFVKGNPSCSCHFRVVIDWDGTNKKHRAASGITLVQDGETVKCKLVK
jgi:hypothetical protein